MHNFLFDAAKLQKVHAKRVCHKMCHPYILRKISLNSLFLFNVNPLT